MSGPEAAVFVVQIELRHVDPGDRKHAEVARALEARKFVRFVPGDDVRYHLPLGHFLYSSSASCDEICDSVYAIAAGVLEGTQVDVGVVAVKVADISVNNLVRA